NLALDDIIYYHKGNRPVHMLCAFSKDVFKRVMFDPNLGFHEDVDFLERARTKPIIISTGVKRCYPHTLKEFVRQQLWYGRTALRYYRKIGTKLGIAILRHNFVLGAFILSMLLIPLQPLLSIAFSFSAVSLITYRWLIKDLRFLGLVPKTLLSRFLWLLLRETIGRISFDLGLIRATLRKRVTIGR
ncbi:MAG: hypothetical protein N3H31_07705, partial [Candidatus Nezhaarchaeota archaeon]|nr:hypothetical protein [Candidatus Nezhaarchaeota archaeon]